MNEIHDLCPLWEQNLIVILMMSNIRYYERRSDDPMPLVVFTATH